jgi:hypothetical protein
MFSYSTGYYVSPPDNQFLKFKNRCSLLYNVHIRNQVCTHNKHLHIERSVEHLMHICHWE